MQVFGRRTRIARRLAMGAAVMALPLAGAGTASAALAGANPATTIRPDLRSATLLGDGVSVRICFDEFVNNTALSATNFRLAGYRASELSAIDIAPPARDASQGNCVIAQFPNEDITNYSTVQVAAGAVTASASGQPNLADGTALSGSTDQSGTRGHTAGPDVLGVVPDPSFNRINVVFDQPVAAGGGGIIAYNNAAAQTAGVLIAVSGNVGVYQLLAPNTATGTVRVFVPSGSVVSTQTGPATPGSAGSAVIPGNSGATLRPDLLSATLSADGASVDYVYDQPISTPNAGQFTARLSTGVDEFTGTSATLINPITVRVNFTGGGGAINPTQVNEYLVYASASATAVGDPSGAGLFGTAGGVPIGGNAGAFASGFTTGADAFSVALDTAGNRVNVTFDQRVQTVNTAGFVLLDNSGNPITGAAPTAIVPPAGGPGNATVGLQFTDAGIVSLTKAVQILGQGVVDQGPATQTFLTTADGQNQTQVVSPTAPAAALKYTKSRKSAHLKKAVSAAKVRKAIRALQHRRHRN